MKKQIAIIAMLVTIGPAYAGDETTDFRTSTALAKIGHSAHGSAFDEGPRQRPVRLQGIGKVHLVPGSFRALVSPTNLILNTLLGWLRDLRALRGVLAVETA